MQARPFLVAQPTITRPSFGVAGAQWGVVAGTEGERRARGPGGLDEGAIGYSSVPLNKAKAKQGLESETLVNVPVQRVCPSGEPGEFLHWTPTIFPLVSWSSATGLDLNPVWWQFWF